MSSKIAFAPSSRVSNAGPIECGAPVNCEDPDLESRDKGGEDRPSPNGPFNRKDLRPDGGPTRTRGANNPMTYRR